jgi:hypothetical protein
MPAIPEPDELSAPFWDALCDGRLDVPECGACGRRFFVPEPLCPHCGAAGWAWARSPGTGTIYSMSVVYQAVDPAQATPFVLAAVDLDDGWTIMTHIVDAAPDDVRIGARVVLRPTRLTDEITVPTFALEPQETP